MLNVFEIYSTKFMECHLNLKPVEHIDSKACFLMNSVIYQYQFEFFSGHDHLIQNFHEE